MAFSKLAKPVGLFASVAICPVALAGVPGNEPATSPGGIAAMILIGLLSLAAIVPLIWRARTAGIRCLVEPVGLMSGAVLFYYVIRGGILLFRDSLDAKDALLSANPATHSDLAWTLGLVLAGVCAFHAGYRLWAPPPARSYQAGDWNPRRVYQAAAVAIALAAVSTGFAVYAAGGIVGAVQTFGCWRVVTTGYGYPLLFLGYWGIAFAFLLQDGQHRGKSIAIAVPALIVANFVDTAVGNRTGVLATWVTAFVLIVLSSRGRKPGRSVALFAVVLAVGVVFAVPMARARSNCVAGTIIRAQEQEQARLAAVAAQPSAPPSPLPQHAPDSTKRSTSTPSAGMHGGTGAMVSPPTPASKAVEPPGSQASAKSPKAAAASVPSQVDSGAAPVQGERASVEAPKASAPVEAAAQPAAENPAAAARESVTAGALTRPSESLTGSAAPQASSAGPAAAAPTTGSSASAKRSRAASPTPAKPAVSKIAGSTASPSPKSTIVPAVPPPAPAVPLAVRARAAAEETWRTLDLAKASTPLTEAVWLRVMDDFLALDSFATIIAVGPEQFPFKFGRTYVDSVLFLVPRKFWPDKPRAYGYEVGQYLQKVDNNLPPGYIGELYINFHVPGILAGMYLMGLLLRWALSWILRADPVALAAYAVLAPYLIIFMGRSIIGGGTLVFILAGLLLPVVYYLRRVPAAPAAEQTSHALVQG